MNFIILGDSVFSSWKGIGTFFGIAAGFLAFVVLSFFVLHRMRFARWIFMLIGGGSYLFLSILAMVQFLRYNAAWEKDFLETGYIVWSQHWDYTDYRDWFTLALTLSASMVFLYIFADRALDVDYIIIKKGYEIVNEFSWFKQTEIVETETQTAHTYLIKVLLFGFGLGVITSGLSDFIIGLFASPYQHYFVYYTVNIIVAGVTALILILLFLRVIKQTVSYR